MAEGGILNHSSTEFERMLTCPLCLDIFKFPKILPCFHTFCKCCLEQLVNRTYGSQLVCPSCRAHVRVPPGGVSEFQNNFYIEPEYLCEVKRRVRSEEKLCPTHGLPDHEFFCVECNLFVCRRCFITFHRDHEILDGCETIDLQRVRLSRRRKQQMESQAKVAAMENVIKKKSAAMIAIVEKSRDDSLASLRSARSQMKKEFNVSAETLSSLSWRFSDLYNGTRKHAVEREVGQGTIGAAKYVTSGRVATHHFLNTKARAAFVTKNIQDYLGVLDKMEVEIHEPEVTAEERFRCEAQGDEEISSLCPLEDGEEVWISYGSYGLNNRLPSKKFKSGKLRLTSKSANGRGSFKSRGSGESLFAEESESLRLTYSKTQRDQHIILSNYCKGTASVKKVIVTSEDPFDTDEIIQFRIKVGPHSAFDADSTGQFCVVVEDSENADSQRKVHLFCSKQENVVATYKPPTPKTQPSDVCFYKLGGKEVLIVSDEGTDTLHVVEFGDKQLQFKRYLDPLCPLLVQPTALNTDTTGRLWIACRGGSILTMTPLSAMHNRLSSPAPYPSF